MGDDALMNSGPALSQIMVAPFGMDRYEVTVARFRRFVLAGRPGVQGNSVAYPSGAMPWSGPTRDPAESSMNANCNWSAATGARERHPINCVDWFTAQAFCVWDGGRMATDPLVGRLPTEAEWEFAARGTDARPYPWGNNPPETRGCWGRPFDDPPATCPVDESRFSMGVSPFGVWHTMGNVMEWAADNYTTYNSDCWSGIHFTGRNPLCVRGVNDERAVRGSNFERVDLGAFHAATRVGFASIVRFEIIGFRCVRSR